MKKIFISYSHDDEALCLKLKLALSGLTRNQMVEIWDDTAIDAGQEWSSEIALHLSTSDIILLLVSPSFVASEFCYSREMMRALERHRSGQATVVPIILRPTDWEHLPFAELQALPRRARAVTEWENIDSAYLSIAQGIRSIVVQNP